MKTEREMDIERMDLPDDDRVGKRMKRIVATPDEISRALFDANRARGGNDRPAIPLGDNDDIG